MSAQAGGESRAAGTGMFSSFLLKRIIQQKAKFMIDSSRTPKKSPSQSSFLSLEQIMCFQAQLFCFKWLSSLYSGGSGVCTPQAVGTTFVPTAR